MTGWPAGQPHWIGPITDKRDAAALRDWLELGQWENTASAKTTHRPSALGSPRQPKQLSKTATRSNRASMRVGVGVGRGIDAGDRGGLQCRDRR